MSYDLTIIGSGPGGYVCALRAAQLGLKTALIEKSPTLGGTCLNVGCIPSKALLHSTEMLHFAQHQATDHGFTIKDVEVSIDKMMARKDAVVNKLVGGVKMLCTKRGVEIFHGFGSLDGPGKVKITPEEGEPQVIESRHIVLASGSVPIEIPALPYDGVQVVHSDHAIAFDQVPESMIVIGAGAIGLELGCVWSRLGSKVTVFEFLDQITPTCDKDIAKQAQRIFEKQGLTFSLATKATGVEVKDGKCVVTAERKGETFTTEADKVLVAIGRKPYADGLNLESAGVELTERGRIKVDADLKTTAANVWAIGDVVDGPMLAHKAEDEGVAVAERIAGKHGHVNYDLIPGVYYTDPEIATVGLTEREAKERGLKVNVGKFPLTANGRALATDHTDGLVKIIADAETDKLLGAAIVAHSGSELIASIVGHMEYGGSAEDLARTVHAHPTISESIKEAALAVDKRPLHSL